MIAGTRSKNETATDLRSTNDTLIFGEHAMGDKGGSKDKGKREKQKKAKQSPKEKRKAQKAKKNKSNTLTKASD